MPTKYILSYTCRFLSSSLCFLVTWSFQATRKPTSGINLHIYITSTKSVIGKSTFLSLIVQLLGNIFGKHHRNNQQAIRNSTSSNSEFLHLNFERSRNDDVYSRTCRLMAVRLRRPALLIKLDLVQQQMCCQQ